MDNAESKFQENVSRNSDTKYSDILIETSASKLDPSTANLLELVRVLENIEVTPERLRNNAWGGYFKEDGARFVF